MTQSAGQLFAAIREEGDGFAAQVPPEWAQGRTAYGGYSTALAYEAARRVSEDLPPLRSAQIAFVGPLAGDVTLRANVLRQGRNATWIAAEIEGEKGIGLTATFVFMRALESGYAFSSRPAPRDLVSLDQASHLPSHDARPTFTSNLELKFARPRLDEAEPSLTWYARLEDRDGLDPTTELLLLADALPPGVLGLGPVRAPMSSMMWQVNLLTDDPATRDGWFLLDSRADHARDGNSNQDMSVWDRDGRPLAAQMQSFALFG
ncbi:MAG: thioesterase family protein [Sphingomonadaceae bacterium]